MEFNFFAEGCCLPVDVAECWFSCNMVAALESTSSGDSPPSMIVSRKGMLGYQAILNCCKMIKTTSWSNFTRFVAVFYQSDVKSFKKLKCNA